MLLIRRIIGDSMYPNYKEGQVVISLKANVYEEGQVVIARQGAKEVIKRITAINKGRYYLLGDNLLKSTDSRQLGAVRDKDIIGKVILVI